MLVSFSYRRRGVFVDDVHVSGVSEVVQGVVPANARLGIGFEQLHLVITDKRIIVVHGAKKGWGGLASMVVVGSHSGAFEDPDKPKTGLLQRTRFEGLDPEKALKSHKDNFYLTYPELIGVEIDDRPKSTSISIVTGDDKFEFFTDVPGKQVSRMLETQLGNRLATRSRHQ